MSETTATVTCWRLRLNLIVIGWKINCLLKHFTMYTMLINSDLLCETLINWRVVRGLMISTNATDHVNMQCGTPDCRDDITIPHDIITMSSDTGGDNTGISHGLWPQAGNENLKTEMRLTCNMIINKCPPPRLCVVWALSTDYSDILTHNLWRIHSCSCRTFPCSHGASGLLRAEGSELLVLRGSSARLRQVVMTSRQIITPWPPGCVNSAVSGTKHFSEQSSIKTRSKMQTCQPLNYLH